MPKVITKWRFNFNMILILPMVFLFAFLLESILPESEGIDNAQDVFAMYAGSLVKIFENNIEPSFSNQTGLNLMGEGKGSIQIANMILDGFRRPDIFLSADTLPIEKLILHNPPLAHWFLNFASAEIVIAYNPNSPFAHDLERASKS